MFFLQIGCLIPPLKFFGFLSILKLLLCMVFSTRIIFMTNKKLYWVRNVQDLHNYDYIILCRMLHIFHQFLQFQTNFKRQGKGREGKKKELYGRIRQKKPRDGWPYPHSKRAMLNSSEVWFPIELFSRTTGFEWESRCPFRHYRPFSTQEGGSTTNLATCWCGGRHYSVNLGPPLVFLRLFTPRRSKGDGLTRDTEWPINSRPLNNDLNS